jgi:hypothetical protein
LSIAAPARAQKPTSKTTEYSPYEKEAISTALEDLKVEVDPAPEDKIVDKIMSVRLEVLEPRDPGPELLKNVPLLSPLGTYVTKPMLNSLHILTKEWIFRRELLVREGEPYIQVLVDETARNMRSRMPLQISLVAILPIKSQEPGKVDLLILTKDIWSLRLSFNVSVTPGGVEDLIIVPQETNFLGLQHTLSTSFEMRPETYTLGLGYKVPRFGYSWFGAAASGSITINKLQGAPEGSSMSISAGQALFSTRTDWAYEGSVGYTVGVARRYSNAHVFLFDSPLTSGRDAIPYEYKSRSFSGAATITRSFGWRVKNNFALSFNASAADYSTFDLSAFNPIAVDDFKHRALPTSESRVYPSLSWSTFTTNFLRTLDVNTLALQEDYRLGHNVGVTIYPVPKALGSSRNLFGITGHAGYTVALGDGFAGASVTGVAEFAENRANIPPDAEPVAFGWNPAITDGSVSGAFGAVTPRLGFGRVAMNASFNNRYRNYLNAQTLLGGSDRLRGYPTNFLSGKDTILYNIEFRSTSIDVLKAQVGGVLFYDAGDAAASWSALNAKQSVGFGLRALFPQVNRLVFRLDFAFPLNRGPFPETGSPAPVDPFGFFFSFDQAFAP